jgi:hypothetical protein
MCSGCELQIGACASHRATVLLSNHSEFDNATTKVKMLAGRGDRPHPFDIESDLVQRYFEVTRNGARAAQIGLERLAATANLSAHSAPNSACVRGSPKRSADTR